MSRERVATILGEEMATVGRSYGDIVGYFDSWSERYVVSIQYDIDDQVSAIEIQTHTIVDPNNIIDDLVQNQPAE